MTQPADNYPAIAFMSIFFTYAGLLAIFLSSMAGTWSAIASLLMGYLVLVAPVVMGVVAYTNREARFYSVPHRWAFYSGALYFAIAPVLFGILLVHESLMGRA